MLRRSMLLALICVPILIFYIACGDSDDNEAETQPTTSKVTTEKAEVIETQKAVIDFAAEEEAIRKLFASHTTALQKRDTGEIMEHWLRLETKEVFMIQDIGGTTTIIEKWSGVKNSWEATWKLIGSIPIPTTMGQVGIDKRGEEATLRGNYTWLGGRIYIAAFRTDEKGKWKIRAIDFGDKGFIKEIKTPRPE